MNMNINKREQTITILKESLMPYIAGYIIYDYQDDFYNNNDISLLDKMKVELESISEDEEDPEVTISYNQFLMYVQSYLELDNIAKDSANSVSPSWLL